LEESTIEVCYPQTPKDGRLVSVTICAMLSSTFAREQNHGATRIF